jgi:hypothetical protein
VKIEYLQEVSQSQEKAQNLLTSVSRLIEKARQTVDSAERHELFLTAMNTAQKAYSLLARAKKLSGELPSSQEP